MGLPVELRKFVAPEFVFGPGARALAGRYARNLGARKALVVSDPGVVAAGWTGQVTDSLAEQGIPFVVYSNVSPNPRDFQVMAGAEVYRNERCNVIVGVGGGSPIDCAKGIGIVALNGRPIAEFAGGDNVPAPGPPLICVPTTAGTAADLSQFAIISAPQRRVKFAIISKLVVPDVALIDPMTTTTLPLDVTASTGLDALTHAIEAILSNAHSPITDLHALQAIRLIWPTLPKVVQDLQNLELRTQMMMGSMEAGLAFSNASLGVIHAMAHSLGGLLDLAHGECNALLVDHAVSFNYIAAPEGCDRIAEAIGLDLRGMTSQARRTALMQALQQYRNDVGLRGALGERKVHRTHVHDLAHNAMNDPCIVTNPRRPNQRDVEVMYEESL